jgi:hypothetical protein
MVDYWGDLMNYEGYQASKKMVGTQVSEQIQEDIITYMNPLLDRDYELSQGNIDDLCQIVVDNFNKKSCN